MCINIGMRVPSAATTSTLSRQSSASSVPAGASFAVLLNAATVKGYPVHQFSGSAAHDTSEGQDKSDHKTIHTESNQSSISSVSVGLDSSPLVPAIAETNASTSDSSRDQANDQGASDGSSANERTASTQNSSAGSDTAIPGHPHGLPDGAPTEPIKVPQDLPASINLVDAPDQDDSTAACEPIELQSPHAGSVTAADAGMLPQPMPFSMLASLAAKRSGLQVAGNATGTAGFATTASGTQDGVGANGSGAGRTGDGTNGSGDSSAHSTQGAPADSIQNAVAAQRVSDISSSHSNVQAMVVQSDSSHASTAPRIANTPVGASHSDVQRQGADSMDADSATAMATSAISDARLMQTLNESQMRIGLSSNAFGDISIRTSISGHQLVAQISLDHSELSQAMSAQVSSVQTKLGDEHGLHALIEINNHASSQPGDAGSSSQRERGSPTAPLTSSSALVLEEEGSGLSQETLLNTANETRLDIRA